MLVLTRKAGEEIRIGDDIVVSVFRTSSGRVKLGIEAPVNLAIRRPEGYHEQAVAVQDRNRLCVSAS